MTKRFPSTVRFRLRRHPNRVHLTRSNVIRRNTAAPSPSSPLLSLVLGATLAKSAPPSRVHFSHPLVGHVQFNQQPAFAAHPAKRSFDTVERSLPAVPCSRCTMLVLMDAFTRLCPVTRVHAGTNSAILQTEFFLSIVFYSIETFHPRNFPSPNFETTMTIPPSSTCFSIKNHTLQSWRNVYIYIYICIFFFLPFISMSSFEGWLELTVL